MITPQIQILSPSDWQDYEFLDSGSGVKLERYGPMTVSRPAPQAIWSQKLQNNEWAEANAIFHSTKDESGGNWAFNQSIPTQSWEMSYKYLKFKAFTSPSRHMGVFPEQACQWDWIAERIQAANRPARVLNLFGYTGLASLAAAKAGAQVTHVDASKKTIQIAKENQSLSGLDNSSIRWIIDDVVKFVRREARRNVKYDGIIMDPPKFGRGPKGEVWQFFDFLPALLKDCGAILNSHPLFFLVTAYAIQASALSLYYAVNELMDKKRGSLSIGELALQEKSASRLLSMAIFVRWQADS